MTDRPIRIDSPDDLEAGLALLARSDPLVARVHRAVGKPPLRRRAPGLEGLARIVVGQQVSTASAEAIWGRFRAAIEPFTAARLAAASDETLRAAGLSAPKIRTLRGLAETILGGGLDLDALAFDDGETAHGTLCAVRGIGPWTADIYLLFCLGHPDVWPAGDLALQHAVGHALGLEKRLDVQAMAEIGRRWRPWRGAAAHLFWAYYRLARGRAGTPV